MSCAELLELPIGSTGILDVSLIDEDGAAINDATVEVTLKDADGIEIAGETWPIAMNYVASSDGKYTVTLTHELEVEANASVFAHGVATGTDGHVREFVREIVVVQG